MKNSNLLNRLLSYSHEKQTPQRFGRYAVMLIMLLTLGVVQMWGTISQRIIYFQPDSWKADGAYFDVHYWQNSNSSNNGDVTMTESNNSGVYYAYIPDWADRVQFVRRNPSGGGEWNRTGNQTVENWYGQCNMSGWDVSSWDNTVWWNAYTVYYDDTETGFTSGVSTPKLRVGTTANTTKDDMTLVTGTKALYYKTKTGGNWDAYHAFCFANAPGATGASSIYDRGTGQYNITKQTEYIRGSLKGDFTFIGHSAGSYYHNYDKCTYYSTEIYYGVKKYTITCTSVDHATVELYYWDPSNTKQIVTEGNSAEVLPTTKVWCKVTPDDGYALRKVNLYDPTEREWTDASNDASERNCYVVRTNVSFTAVIEPYATKTILVKDINSWAPDHMYIKGWNPFLYEGYDNAQYHYTTQKVMDKITLCSNDYYVITISNEFPFYYIHNEGDGVRTAFFATNRLDHMAKYDDYTSGDGNWGLRTAACDSDPIYWVETYKGSGPKYISNIVSNTTDTMSFYVESGSTVEFHAGASSPVNQYSSVFAKYFAADAPLYGKAGGVFTATTNGSGLTNDAIFEGDYHIHVNAKTRNYLNAGGVSKAGTTGTKFIRFDKSSLFGDTFDHYWVDWFLGSGDGYAEQSVVATVGNIYNANLAGVLGADAFAPKGKTQSTGGNVRYGYDPETNHFERAIIAAGDEAVKISSNVTGAIMVSTNEGETYTQDATTPRDFDDATNWNYQVYAQVKGNSLATATTSYVAGTQTLALDKKLIGGKSDDFYNVIINYDFKTNRFIAAWNPKGTSITEPFDLQSNLMVVRVENESPTVLNVTGSGDLTNITQIYTVLEITEANWSKSGGNADRRIVGGGYIDEYYWISLPYDCRVSDIFGVSNYGNGILDHWMLQTYRGDLRAEKGWWAETNAWWYDMERTDTLKANVGYVLRLTNLDSEFPGTGTKLHIYFPSASTGLQIAPLTGTVTTKADSLKCTKWQKKPNDPTEGENNPIWDRRAIDSNWRIIGSPSFNSTKITAPDFSDASYDTDDDGWIDQDEMAAAVAAAGGVYGLKYFYDWEVDYNDVKGTYTPVFTVADAEGTEFKGTHAHLVQYAGTITWTAYDGSNPLVGITNKVAARHQEEGTEEQTLRLVLKRGERNADVAYISRMAFGATMGYDLNMDLSKMINANSANIYTMGELYKMAGNCIPDTVTILPVGVQLATDGAYTFAMPDGTYGTGITLIDKVADTRTNLALTDYTVNLTAGTYDERFEIELSPIAQTPTDIETISDERLEISGVRKVMVDGVLYIVKDGVVFDAQGNRVR